MALVINTNVMSLNAQRNLTTSAGQLATSLQRLSSGLRINSAKDDAAGLAISNRMTTQINGLNQAVRNANDGISLAQTTEGALQEVTNNLQRIRALAVQSANATNSEGDRRALDQEVQQRIQEIERIASQTSFNGRRVLDGSFGGATFQVGANVGETIELALTASVKSSAIGQVAVSTGSVNLNSLFQTGGVAAGLNLEAGDLTVNVNSGGAVNVAAGNYTTAAGLVAAINTASGSTIATVSGNEIEITGPTGGVVFAGGSAAGLGLGTVADAATATSTGVNAAVTAPGTAGTPAAYTLGETTIQVGSGTAVNVAGEYATAQDLVTAINSQVTGAFASINSSNQLVISASEAITLGGAGASALGVASAALGGSLGTQNVTSVAGANSTILSVDAALASVSDLRGTLGAIQNRFESTINSLQSVSENLSASRSRILDTDFAAETAALTRAQILQQAGTAMVAQANAVPQNVLSLLR